MSESLPPPDTNAAPPKISDRAALEAAIAGAAGLLLGRLLLGRGAGLLAGGTAIAAHLLTDASRNRSAAPSAGPTAADPPDSPGSVPDAAPGPSPEAPESSPGRSTESPTEAGTASVCENLPLPPDDDLLSAPFTQFFGATDDASPAGEVLVVESHAAKTTAAAPPPAEASATLIIGPPGITSPEVLPVEPTIPDQAKSPISPGELLAASLAALAAKSAMASPAVPSAFLSAKPDPVSGSPAQPEPAPFLSGLTEALPAQSDTEPAIPAISDPEPAAEPDALPESALPPETENGEKPRQEAMPALEPPPLFQEPEPEPEPVHIPAPDPADSEAPLPGLGKELPPDFPLETAGPAAPALAPIETPFTLAEEPPASQAPEERTDPDPGTETDPAGFPASASPSRTGIPFPGSLTEILPQTSSEALSAPSAVPALPVASAAAPAAETISSGPARKETPASVLADSPDGTTGAFANLFQAFEPIPAAAPAESPAMRPAAGPLDAIPLPAFPTPLESGPSPSHGATLPETALAALSSLPAFPPLDTAYPHPEDIWKEAAKEAAAPIAEPAGALATGYKSAPVLNDLPALTAPPCIANPIYPVHSRPRPAGISRPHFPARAKCRRGRRPSPPAPGPNGDRLSLRHPDGTRSFTHAIASSRGKPGRYFPAHP